MMSTIRRTAAIAAIALTASVALTSEALANSASISPASQTRAYGSLFTWNTSWAGGSGAYKVIFAYGDGDSTLINGTSARSRTFSKTFYPCGGTTYNQRLTVTDGLGTIAQAGSKATVTGGGAC